MPGSWASSRPGRSTSCSRDSGPPQRLHPSRRPDRRMPVDTAPRPPASRFFRTLHGLEEGALVVAFLVSMVVPLVDAIGRPFGHFSIPGSEGYRAQLTLWLAFIGGLLAARERRHLTLSTAEAMGKAAVRNVARLFSSSIAAAVCAVLAYSAWGVVMADRDQGTKLAIGL